jgi:hypothetical protein
MQNVVNCEDVLASHEKFGCVLVSDPKNANDLREKNPKSKYDVTYIPVLFRHINGKNIPMTLKFNEQLISANVKNPSSDEDDIPKNLNISFSKMPREAVEGGDYVPKKRDTDEAQEKEDARVSGNIDRYLSNNEDWIKILNILADSYKEVCEDLISRQSEFKFKIRKNRKSKEIPIIEFRQVSREDKTTGEDIELENPIFRFKLGVCKNRDQSEYDGRIGYYSKYYSKFVHTVYDARKMNSKNNYAKVPAMVKIGNKKRHIDFRNASSFISFKSLVGGTWQFRSICASKSGLSPDNNFKELYVYRHKAKMTSQALSNDDILQMRGGAASDDEDESDDEPGSDEEKTESRDKDAEPKDSDDESDEEEAPDAEDDDDEEEEAPDAEDDDDEEEDEE